MAVGVPTYFVIDRASDDGGAASNDSANGDQLQLSPCSPEEAISLQDSVKPRIEHFDDANQRASRTSRIALSPVLGELQDVKRQFNNITMPSCADEARSLMVKYMEAVIDAYLAFLADEPDSVVENYFEDATNRQTRAVEAWTLIFLEAALARPSPTAPR